MVFTADILGDTVAEVGYHLSIKRAQQDLLFGHRLLLATLDDEFKVRDCLGERVLYCYSYYDPLDIGAKIFFSSVSLN